MGIKSHSLWSGFGEGFWATWGPFRRDLRPVGRDWRALEAIWKGLESLGGLWKGLGTPRSQDFEDVSSRLLDYGGPACAVLAPLRTDHLGLRTRPQTTETLGQSYEDLKRPQARQNLKSTVHISTVLRQLPLSLEAPVGAGGYIYFFVVTLV